MHRRPARAASGAIRGGLRLAPALLALALFAAACGEAPPPSGLLLVSVDTLRADALGAYGARGDLTPNLDVLARESLVFDAAYAPAPFTFPSVASILSGRYPRSLGVLTNESLLPDGVPTLASSLHELGFRTGAVVSSSVLRHKARLSDHFDFYDDALSPSPGKEGVQERVAARTTDAALALLDRLLAAAPAETPRWMLWVHYQDPHGPYTPPEEFAVRARALEPDAGRLAVLPSNHGGSGIPNYQALGDEREVAFYRGGYHGEVAYLDREFGRLWEGLAARGVRGGALVAFTADHGEALGEHDVWFCHGHDLTDELLRVPLFLHGPGIDAGRRADVVSLVDLYPTLLARLGGAAAPGLPGRDLLARGAEDRDSVPYLDTLAYGATRRLGLVAAGYKLILSWRDGVWQARLYRRGHEDVDLGASAPQVTAGLRAELARLRGGIERGRPAEQQQALTPAERAQLEALGYVDKP